MEAPIPNLLVFLGNSLASTRCNTIMQHVEYWPHRTSNILFFSLHLFKVNGGESNTSFPKTKTAICPPCIKDAVTGQATSSKSYHYKWICENQRQIKGKGEGRKGEQSRYENR
jgi:hypothetical protein